MQEGPGLLLPRLLVLLSTSNIEVKVLIHTGV